MTNSNPFLTPVWPARETGSTQLRAYFRDAAALQARTWGMSAPLTLAAVNGLFAVAIAIVVVL